MLGQANQGLPLNCEAFQLKYGVQLRTKNSFLEFSELPSQKPGRGLTKQLSWSCPAKLNELGDIKDVGEDILLKPTRHASHCEGRLERGASEDGQDSACCPSEHSYTESSTTASTAITPNTDDTPSSGKSDGFQAERCRSGSEDSTPCEAGREAGKSLSQPTDIESWGEDVHTVMVKNLPQRLKRQDLITFLEEFGFADRCNFLYVPTRRNKLGVYPRYAFVGFDRAEDTIGFAKAIRGHRFRQSQKEVQCLPADIQGLEANMQHFSGTRVVGSRWCPLTPAARENRGNSGELNSSGHAWGRLKIPQQI